MRLLKHRSFIQQQEAAAAAAAAAELHSSTCAVYTENTQTHTQSENRLVRVYSGSSSVDGCSLFGGSSSSSSSVL
jgi:hypothetical protein